MVYSVSTQFNLIRTVAGVISISIKNCIAVICTVVAISVFAPFAYAEGGKTILVLDASGSMWGKISDGYKIRVARNVVNNLLESLPADQEIGLVSYGHREKDSCDDIELLVPPVTGTRDAIIEAIEALDPKGKTPLSAAVIKAADELGLEENDATVILISDGEETCSMDPCAVAFELEKRGIDFIAHVVGFDIKKSDDQAQLQCLAENTGGLFFSASNESELTEALDTISFAMSEAAKQVQFSAVVQDHKRTPVRTDIQWTLKPISTADNTATTANINLLSDENRTAETVQASLDPGRYTLSVTRNSDGVTTSLDLDLTSSEVSEFVLTLPPKASIEGPITVSIGEIFDVEWQGPGQEGDLIAVANSVSPDAEIIAVFTAKSADAANKTTLVAPTEPGKYELRYVYAAQRSVIATTLLDVADASITLDAPDEANAGYLVAVDWEGPNVPYDTIAVAEVGSAESINETGTYLGKPATVQMPSKPGTYEIRYVLHQDRKILASRKINVAEGAIELNAPNEVGLGYLVNVDWVGPNAPQDIIALAEVGASENLTETGTILGNPAQVRVPTKPGDYELRYILDNGRTTMATRSIKVIEAGVVLDAPTEASVGEIINVNWTGPNQPSDVIAVAELGSIDNLNTSGTYLGNPSKLQMPITPGNYEIRYVLHQDQTVMASQPITVIDAEVLLKTPNESNVID